MKYYLGLDNGGSNTKAAIFDTKGKEIGSYSISTEMITLAPGFAESDMEEKWLTNCEVIKGALREHGIKAVDVVGIGICGHGKGLYLWGKDDKPVRNGITSNDTRAYRYPIKWREDGTEEKVFKISCQHIMECQPVALLAWIKDNEPDNYKNIKWVFECKDYIRFRLTGEPKAERTDYSGANLLNLYTKEYDEELLGLFGLAEIKDALPPLCNAIDICGYVTEEAADQCGLLPGTPVIGGMFDIDACALATGIFDEDNICAIAGTWSINEYIRKKPIVDGSVRMNSLFALPEYYLVEESSPTSAGNNEWFIRNILPEVVKEAKASGRSQYDVMNIWVESVSPKEFVPVFLPYIMASNVHPNARGTFVGISLNTTRAHMLRSVYEGIVFCHKMHIDKLLASRSTPPKAIRLAGGAAHSRVWTQIFADVLQMPIEFVEIDETGAFGCALAVSVAVGDYKDLHEAAEKMCAVSGTVLPRREYKEIYEKKYRLYRRTIECLDPLWDEMQEVIEGDE